MKSASYQEPTMTHPLASLKRRLERWELDHLRQLASDLAYRLERAEEDARSERKIADYWNDQATSMMRDLMEDSETIGLTKVGTVGVIDITALIRLPDLATGERYLCGIVNDDGTITHSILLPGDNDRAGWVAQKEWAASIGGNLLNRTELLAGYEKMPEEFQKEAYWSESNHVSASGYAWSQDFHLGYQYYSTTDDELRARAVRRLTI
jgi:hypothetical protein